MILKKDFILKPAINPLELGFLILLTTAFLLSSIPQHKPQSIELPENLGKNSFYKMEFLNDGYPGKRVQGQLLPHPIYATYVIKYYLQQYGRRPDPEYLRSAQIVADATLKRMSNFKGTLVFWYPKGFLVGRSYKPYYSGLTQAYYTVLFYQLYELTGKVKYKEAAYKIFKSLTIPNQDGGVLDRFSGGVSIAEVPQQPSSVILNGWLSALVAIDDYARLSKSQEAHQLFQENLQTLSRILPLFDAKAYLNSRYSLTGFTKFYLHCPKNNQLRIENIMLEIPTEGRFPVQHANARENRWKNFIRGSHPWYDKSKVFSRKGKLELNLVLSRLSFPQTNKLTFQISSVRPTTVQVLFLKGEYDPLKNEPAHYAKVKLTAFKSETRPKRISIDIPWNQAELIGYPTNFVKKIKGKPKNVYHTIHINKLDELYQRTGDPILKSYADKWRAYKTQWPSSPTYQKFFSEEVSVTKTPSIR